MAIYDNDKNFHSAILVVLKHEGGYVKDKNDAGGETNFGISKATYPNVDIANLTVDQACDIYYRDWWVHYAYNQITDSSLATKVFDTAVNVGSMKANKLLQRCLNVNGYPNIVDDGGLGPISINATNACNPQLILPAYRGALANYYKAVVAKNPQDQKFLKGWLARASQ